MARWVKSYVAIQGEESQVRDLIERCFEPVGSDRPFFGVQYTLYLDCLLPMPQELEDSAAETRVFDTRQEADQSHWRNREPSTGKVRNFEAITREEAERRAQLYGRDTDGDPILNRVDWCLVNWGTVLRELDVRQIHRSDGQFAFSTDTPWASPGGIYRILIEMGFRVDWVWKGESDVLTGAFGERYDVWKQTIRFDFDHDAAQGEWRKKPEPMDLFGRRELSEEEMRLQERKRRLEWAEWFQKSPENRGMWREWFPNHSFEEWINRLQNEDS